MTRTSKSTKNTVLYSLFLNLLRSPTRYSTVHILQEDRGPVALARLWPYAILLSTSDQQLLPTQTVTVRTVVKTPVRGLPLHRIPTNKTTFDSHGVHLLGNGLIYPCLVVKPPPPPLSHPRLLLSTAIILSVLCLFAHLPQISLKARYI